MPRSLRSRPLAAVLGLALAGVLALPATSHAGSDGDLSRTLLLSSNDGLRAQGMDYMLQQIDYFGHDGARSSARYFQQEFRWVADDSRRGKNGSGLTFLVDESWSDGSASPLDQKTLERVVAKGAETWRNDSCLADWPLRQTPYPGGDVTVFDYLLGTGGFGHPFAADVVVAGLPAGMEEVFGDDVLAFAVTFVFVDGSGTPTDVDGDGHLDTALNEIYFNPQAAWATDGGAEGIDLESAALHELGHAIGLGHFGAPPESVMTPVYSGPRRTLYPIDHAALCLLRR